MLLEYWYSHIQSLLDTGQIFRGHTKFKTVYDTSAQLGLQDCVLHHVSAHGLTNLLPPTSLKAHSKLNSNDKAIWDAAYHEEFDGLESLPTWEVLSEERFCQLGTSHKALPTMAIAMIKYDANNRPKRAKYCLVDLSNLDYHI
jgi:hypothetical protein